MRLTAQSAAYLLRVAEQDGRTPRTFDRDIFEWRPLTAGEVAKGRRYIRRDEQRCAADLRRARNLGRIGNVAAASALPLP